MLRNDILSPDACAILLLSGLALLAFGWRAIRDSVRAVGRRDILWLILWMAAGLALRLIGGNRIPAAPNSNGFCYLNILFQPGACCFGPWGNGPDGFYTSILFRLVPCHESCLVATQVCFSVLTIPAVYVVWCLFSGNRDAARWAAAVMAILPAPVFFAATEEILVPAVFFMLVTLAVFGVAFRQKSAVLMFASVFMAAFTAQFRYTLLIIPAIALAYAIAIPAGRNALKRPSTWAAAVLLTLLLSPSLIRIFSLVKSPNNDLAMQSGAISMFYRAFVPMWLNPDSEYFANVFFSPFFTPPILPLFAILGVYKGRKNPGLVVTLGAGLLFTVFGIISGGVNTARMQLPAQPFFAMLTGLGIAAALKFLEDRTRISPRACWAAGALLLFAGLVVTPGPIGSEYSYQIERRAFIEGLESVPDGCTVFFPRVGHIPYYLSTVRRRNLKWVSIDSAADLNGDLDKGCWIYYRSSRCFELGAPPADLPGKCRSIEEGLKLEPVFTHTIDKPPYTERFNVKTPLIGFYRIVGRSLSSK